MSESDLRAAAEKLHQSMDALAHSREPGTITGTVTPITAARASQSAS